MKTTLNKIRAHSPCTDGWKKLLKTLGKIESDDEPLSIITIIDSNGLDDALWCLRAVEGEDKKIRLFMVWCARQVLHHNSDPRVKNAIDVAAKFAHGEASTEELGAAYSAAYSAYSAAYSAYSAYSAAYSAYSARSAAYSAAYSARSAARSAAYSAQEIQLRKICGEKND